ncbi:carboxylesterase/lipase family protein [Massilia aquatica]|uniref:Carboxylic ester hydrolase n=1 Tax=Massilia aquatica TaxID=2609000 RepID=A0ABX0M6S0_9BURK|nr:carboxylesterase family protein [Massilia aquatica]NHZ42920.1 carboxylesterase family protein [Massilia aquatica]
MANFVLAGMLAAAVTASPAPPGSVKVSGGSVAGLAMADGSTIYYGIPYAAAPAGERRWKPPVERAPWSGVLDARKPASACVQENVGWNGDFLAGASEDCLSLSIRAPAAGKTRLPVLVYIHGGANSAAGAGNMAEDAIHREGVVMVRIQYRLGLFGFMGLDALREESPNKSSGNYALLDQIAALKWIKANIAAFGGDPGNITISGNSSGAFDALLLTISPLAKGLFQKAILQAAAPGASMTAQQNEEVGKVVLERLKLPQGAAGLAQLRALPAEAVIKAGLKLPLRAGIDPTFLWGQQVVDGYVLPYAYHEAYARGAGRGIAIIIGSNRQELGADRKPAVIPAMLASAFGEQASAARALYGDDARLGSIPTQLMTDMWFRCPVTWLTSRMLKATPKVWRYEFGFGVPGSGRPPEHTSEMHYVYNAVPAAAVEGAWAPLQRYWANFLRKGDPNGSGLPPWPAMGPRAAYLSFAPEGTTAGEGLRSAICELMYKERDYPASPVAPG